MRARIANRRWQTGAYGELAYGKLAMTNWFMAKRRSPIELSVQGLVGLA